MRNLHGSTTSPGGIKDGRKWVKVPKHLNNYTKQIRDQENLQRNTRSNRPKDPHDFWQGTQNQSQKRNQKKKRGQPKNQRTGTHKHHQQIFIILKSIMTDKEKTLRQRATKAIKKRKCDINTAFTIAREFAKYLESLKNGDPCMTSDERIEKYFIK